MTRREQKQFVRDLTTSAVKAANELIDTRKMPANWDGHELRLWLAQWFAANITHVVDKRSAWFKAYTNDCIVNNL